MYPPREIFLNKTEEEEGFKGYDTLCGEFEGPGPSKKIFLMASQPVWI